MTTITIKTKSEDLILAEGSTVKECVDNYNEYLKSNGHEFALTDEDIFELNNNPWYGDFEDIYFDEQ